MRQLKYSLMIESYRKIAHYIGAMMGVMSGLILTPLLLLIFDHRELSGAAAFIYPALICILLYLVLGKLIGRTGSNAMSYDEAVVTICLTWLLMCAISAIPFLGLTRMRFAHAYFEAMSGYTTTGLTLIDYVTTPNLIYLWRSIMQFIGGAGIAVLLISFSNAPFGSGLTEAEGKSDLLVPHIKHSTRLVVIIYGSYAVVGAIALKIAGLNWFDSINHTFAALSTGGFSTHPESIAIYNSRVVEALILVMMILGNLNFLNAYILFKGKVKDFIRNGEVQAQLILIPVATVILLFALTYKLYGSLATGLRISLFETVSALTTTGFTSTIYTHWSDFGFFILTVLMLIGGGSSSTAGGFKQFRLYFLWKSLIQLLKEMTSTPGRVVRLAYWWGDKKYFLSSRTIQSLFLFFTVYFGAYFSGLFIFTLYGIPLRESLFEVASTLANAGLSIGVTSPHLPVGLIWTQVILMYIGRLEIVICFVAIGKVFRDFNRIID